MSVLDWLVRPKAVKRALILFSRSVLLMVLESTLASAFSEFFHLYYLGNDNLAAKSNVS